jgi:hypothetical protein
VPRLRLPDWRRVVIYSHRWLGIAGGLLFIAWFASGIVMIYAQMPRLADSERRARLPPLDFSTAAIAPAAAGAGAAVVSVRLAMVQGRPVYRFVEGGRPRTVFADTGSPLDPLTRAQALDAARAFAPPGAAAAYDAYIAEPDQWTLEARALLPMHRIAFDDPGGTVLYVSDRTGDPAMETTRAGRRWAYAGAVVHWLYLAPFRRHAAVWAQAIIWLSLAGTVMCALGLLWGAWRFSPRLRYRLKHVRARSPYAGAMRWHHYAGLLCGVTTLTWIFSGLLSMDPWDWHPGTSPTPTQRRGVAGAPDGSPDFTVAELRRAAIQLEERNSKEAQLVWFLGEPFLSADEGIVSIRAPRPGVFAQFDAAAVDRAAGAAMPGAAIEETAWLTAYDAYYYDRDGELGLPVVRIRYRDAPRTWLYLDPRRGVLVRKEESLSRLNRWLYHGLHSFDFPFLYYRRPLWDAVVIALSLGGLISAVTALFPAWRRLRRHVRRAGTTRLPIEGSTSNRDSRSRNSSDAQANHRLL